MIYIIFQIKNIFIYIIKDKHLKTNRVYYNKICYPRKVHVYKLTI